jgi:hypothetical protein
MLKRMEGEKRRNARARIKTPDIWILVMMRAERGGGRELGGEGGNW